MTPRPLNTPPAYTIRQVELEDGSAVLVDVKITPKGIEGGLVRVNCQFTVLAHFENWGIGAT